MGSLESIVLDGSDGYFFAVEGEFPHPEYVPGEVEHNVMVVKLKSFASNFTTQVLNSDNHLPVDGADLFVSGFSRRATDQHLPQSTNEAQASKLDHTTCSEKYSKVDGVYIVDDRIFCSSTVDPQECHGNMGDPVLDGHGSQVGIVVGGSDCDTAELPTLNARVSALQGFLRDAVCQLSSAPPDACPKTTTSPTNSPSLPGNETNSTMLEEDEVPLYSNSSSVESNTTDATTEVSDSAISDITQAPNSSAIPTASPITNSSIVPTTSPNINENSSFVPTVSPTTGIASSAPSDVPLTPPAEQPVQGVLTPGTNPSYAFSAGRTTGKLCGASLIHDDLLLTAASCMGVFAEGALLGGQCK